MPVQELALCIRESISHLEEVRVVSSLCMHGNGAFHPGAIILAYDFFEAAVEAALPSLSALLVNLRADADGLALRLSMEDVCAALPGDWEAARLAQHRGEFTMETQGETLFATLRLRKAGDQA